MSNHCDAPVAKFRDYIFRADATHGKDAVFRALGYASSDSERLREIYVEQAAERYAAGDYTLGKQDEYGQRINIEIVLQGVGDAAGQTSCLRSGWMIQADGSLHLNTPFTGFTR